MDVCLQARMPQEYGMYESSKACTCTALTHSQTHKLAHQTRAHGSPPAHAHASMRARMKVRTHGPAHAHTNTRTLTPRKQVHAGAHVSMHVHTQNGGEWDSACKCRCDTTALWSGVDCSTCVSSHPVFSIARRLCRPVWTCMHKMM